MKELIAVLLIISIPACSVDEITPTVNEFVWPTESAAPKEITLPYGGEGIKVELIKDIPNLYEESHWQWPENLYFLNEDEIFSYRSNELYKSNDGGDTWELKLSIPKTSTYSYEYLSGLTFVPNSMNIGFAIAYSRGRCPVGCAGNGRILKTSDRGETWEVVYQNPNLVFRSIYSMPTKPGVVIAAGSGTIMRSANYGKTWETVYEGNFSSPGSIISLANKYLYISTYEGLLMSGNNGSSWGFFYSNIFDQLHAISSYSQNGSKIMGSGYHTETPYYNYSPTKVFRTVFNPETFEVIKKDLVYESPDADHLIEHVIIRPTGEPFFRGKSNDGISYKWFNIMYPNNAMWQPLVIKWSDETAYYDVMKVSCFDNECYILIATSGNSWGAKLLKLTFNKS